MVRKKKRRIAPARTPLSDEELIQRLKEKAPEVLAITVSEAAFEGVVGNLLAESPKRERPHFYCRKCGEYHLKTHKHFKER